MEISKLRAQNTRINLTLNSETQNNNNKNNNNNNYSKAMFGHAQQHPKSAECATMGNKVFPCITMDNVEHILNADINCYEERLRRIEEEIKTYKNEVKSYAYDNLRTAKNKIEFATKNCNLSTTPLAKQGKQTVKVNCEAQQHNKNNNNNNNNNKCSANNSISSERCSSGADFLNDAAVKQQISSLPELNVKNAYLKFLTKRAHKKLPNHGNEIGTGGSGDHVTGEKLNRRLESSVQEYQQQQLHDHEKRLQFKHSVSNLIKSQLQSTPATATRTFNPANSNNTNSNNIMQTNEYRYKSSGRRKTTKAF